jgi:CRISPR-associated protein Csb2
MPWIKDSKNTTTLIFDTFVVMDKKTGISIIWPNIDLDKENFELLVHLCQDVSYFGRSETWCRMYIDDNPPLPNCYPLCQGQPVPEGSELVRILAPADFNPINLLESLMVETGDLRNNQKKSQPPNSQWLTYLRPKNALIAVPPVRIPKLPLMNEYFAARYVLDRKPLPRVQETLRVGEMTRVVAMGCYGRLNSGSVSSTLSGKVDGKPMASHQHAYYLPSDEDHDGFIDHLTVYSPVSFDEREKQALASIRTIPMGDAENKLQVLFLGFATKDDLIEIPHLFGPGRYWTSSTPLVLTRYPKFHSNGSPKINERGQQKDGVEDQIHREWEQVRMTNTDLPHLVNCRLEPRLLISEQKSIRWLEFAIKRSRVKGVTSGLIYGVTLEFEEPVHGPMAFGYSCHFGLGLLIPRKP